MNITDLLEGDYAIIKDCDHYRLLEHGFTNGTKINIYKKINGVTCVYLRGAVIGVRDEELKDVFVSKVQNTYPKNITNIIPIINANMVK